MVDKDIHGNSIPSTLYELAERLPYYVRDVSDFKCEKEIGRGGFGVVWLGTDLKTGEKVAVKELLFNRLSSGESRHYIREIYTMALTTNRYIVPLVGFTVEHPYTIITKYEENGQLSKYIRSKYIHANAQKLSGTHLTIIAMCLASALMDFELNNIVHRDLKSGNILMGEKLLPKICDFGTARIFSPRSQMTNKIGTINYMAPEVMSDKSYDNKVDVYGFGMVLYEMCEGRVPFSDFKRDHLLQLIPDQSINLEFAKTPKDLKKFIKKCTDFDPDNRPTPEEIYNMFSSGKLAFPGTKKKKILKIHEMITSDELRRRNGEKKIPEVYVNIEEVLNKLDKTHQQSPKPSPKPSASQSISNIFNDVDFDFKFLEDPRRSDFSELLEKCDKKLSPDNYTDFSVSIVKSLQARPKEETVISIFEVIMKHIIRDYTLMSPLMEASFYQEMTLTSPALKDMGIEFFGILFKFKTGLVRASLTKSIAQLIHHNPEAMVIQLGHYIRNLPPQNESFPVISIFTDESSIFLNSHAAPSFIKLLYHLISTNQHFREEALMPLSPVFMKACVSSDEETAITAILAVINILPDPNFVVDFEALLSIAANDNLRRYLISLTLRIMKYPSSRRLAQLLLGFATRSNRGFLALMNYASSSYENAVILSKMHEYLLMGLPNVLNTFRLFLVLFSYSKLRTAIISLPEYPTMLMMFLKEQNEFIFGCMPSIIRRSSPNSNLILALQKIGFYQLFYTIAIASESESVLNSALLMSDSVSSIQYIDEVSSFIPKISGILKNHQNLTQQAITVLVRMSFLKETHPYLVVLKPYFESLTAYPNYAQYAKSFLSNFQ
ncbi:TKL family protein kinase [Tritrichomonas foetus]|uniref:TKL family protein kinase n=1 Tax=Tritrichomonas foetus TaxID=1144522 RepID=A0A1J4KZ89_9EUKA|nr:TKL family protein kinase [Tritrichomonas foetus]|eukprot:OHT16567.1 TKL family protein kinase [Tritrichomonas foetus]